ncbi:MFS transporter [Pseudonocardia alaniniphila]|uniref:MFS transporter n=2 Tax=Pseudonocardia alaniniphila TaxID=75291 RepID=A0ABS9TST5_9PSEU|nr:MFS transporter [Pseudonocardia alaniniphila]
MPPPARPLARRMLGWALLADVIPLYPLYALLFADSGLSAAEISALFAIWSAVGVVAEVPSGALADRFSRRACLVAAGVLQACGYGAWVLLPSFAGFALGFVLWGLGGVLVSGAQEALLYDGLVAAGAEEQYARVNGWVTAAELVAQLPAALAATVLYAVGGFPLVGWVSVGVCLAAAAMASRLPEPPRGSGTDEDEDELSYLATLRAGLVVAANRPGVRAVVVATALLGAFDAVEEYFPLIVVGWGVPTAFVPVADLPIVLAGVVGAALAGRAGRLGSVSLAVVLGAAMFLFGAAGLADHPAGIAALAAFYGAYRCVLVVVDARLQERIESRSRATVTSVAGIGTDIATFGVYAAWAVGAIPLVAALGVLISVALPRLLRAPVAPDVTRSG